MRVLRCALPAGTCGGRLAAEVVVKADAVEVAGALELEVAELEVAELEVAGTAA
jgi:hypothetical protein